ncbi:MAG: hypothetical protein KA712_18160 [Myxococcales bacterium]|nr:hypothetical protein [Myxococcales bacterium]
MRQVFLWGALCLGLVTLGAPVFAAPSVEPPAAAETGALAPLQVVVPGQEATPHGAPDPKPLDLSPRPPEPGVSLDRPANEGDRSVVKTWWFWGAVAGVVVTTVAIVLVAGGSESAPATDLGDMRAFRN